MKYEFELREKVHDGFVTSWQTKFRVVVDDKQHSRLQRVYDDYTKIAKIHPEYILLINLLNDDGTFESTIL